MTNYAALMTTPEYDNYGESEPIKVSLLWLIQNIVGSCDFDEDEIADHGGDLLELIMDYKCSDTGMGYLLESMLLKGHLREGAIGAAWFDGGVYLTEGHHRLCAAILLGLDEVWVSRNGKSIRSANGHSLVSAHDSWDYNTGTQREDYPIELV